MLVPVVAGLVVLAIEVPTITVLLAAVLLALLLWLVLT